MRRERKKKEKEEEEEEGERERERETDRVLYSKQRAAGSNHGFAKTRKRRKGR